MGNQNTINVKITVSDDGSVKVQQFANNTASEFKKVEQSAGGLKQSFTSTFAAMTAGQLAAQAVFAMISKGFAEMEKAAKGTTVKQSFDTMAEAAGTSGDKMLASLKSATVATVSSTDLMQKSVKAMILGYDPDQIVKFGEISRTSARITGDTVGESYDRIVDAVANKMPRALVSSGLLTKEQSRLITQAVAANIEDFDLYALVVANAELAQAKLGQQTVSDMERMQQFHVQVSAISKTIGIGLLNSLKDAWPAFETLGKVVGVVAYGSLQAFSFIVKVAWTSLEGLAGVALLAAAGIVGFAEKVTLSQAWVKEAMGDKAGAEGLRRNAADMKQTYNTLVAATEGMGEKITNQWFSQEKAIKKTSQSEIAAKEATVQAEMEKINAKIAAAKQDEKNKAAADAAAKKLAEAEKDLTNETQKTLADRKKYEGSFYNWKVAEAEAGLQKYKDAGVSEWRYAEIWAEKRININAEIYAEYKKTLKSWEEDTKKKQADMIAEDEKVAEDVKKRAEQQREATRNLYKDLEQYSGQYYDVQANLIAEQAQNYRDILIDEKTSAEEAAKYEVAIATWTTQELKKLGIEKGKSSDDFLAGLKAGIDEIQLKQTKWGQVGYDTFKGMSVGMATTFSTVFEDAYKRDLKSIGDYSTMIWDTTRLAFFKAAGDMAQQSLIINISAGWTDAGKSTLGIVDKLLSYAGVTSSLYASAEALNLGQYVGVNFSQGGPIPGNARYPGDHPGNDTVPIWASPGEVMIRRSSVNSETSAILDYINKFGSVPAYYGGGVINTITNEPGRGYWGFSSFFESVQDIWSSVNPMGKNVLGSPTAQQIVDSAITQAITKAVVIAGIAYVAGAVGAGLYGAAGAGAAGAGGAGSTAGTGSALTYGSPEFVAASGKIGLSEAAALSLTDASLGGISATQLSTMTAAEIGMTLAQKIGSNILSHIMKGPGGDMGANKAGDMGGSFNLGIAGGYGSGVSKTLSDLFGAMPKSQIISADTGIDYIPRDGVLVSTHKKEAILNADAAEQWRSGRGSGDASELLAELKKLNASLDRVGFVLSKNTGKSARILDQWNGDGLPAERVLQ